MGSYGNIGGGNPTPNPIIKVGLEALESDNLFFVENPEEQYVGLYHEHQDGTLMIGEGVLGVNHELKPNEIIFKKFGYQDLQETREVVSDIFYKIWFESNTLTDDEILSMQTTIRDGIKQTGRTEDEPLVFYKKDRNRLESKKDLQGETFEQMCQYIEFCADRLLQSLGVDKIYNTANPFDWMNLISLQGKTNFFEKRVGEYSKAGVGGNAEEAVFSLECDF